jgi:hypothetical protein
MRARHRRDAGSSAEGLAALAFAVVGTGCCAGLPLLLMVASTVAVGAILSITAGIVMVAVS